MHTSDTIHSTSSPWCSRIGVAAAFSLLMACDATEYVPASPAETGFELLAPPSFTRGLLTRFEPKPLYPLRARNQLVQGWVMLHFDVDENGQVIADSLEIEEEQPPGYFSQSALSAARRLSFENTRGVVVGDIHYVFRYELEEQTRVRQADTVQEPQFRELIPGRYITPAYPAAAEREGIEGYVIVTFTVTSTGAVQDIEIRESSPPAVFDEEALRAAARLRFEPRLVNGDPVAVENVDYRFDWNLPR